MKAVWDIIFRILVLLLLVFAATPTKAADTTYLYVATTGNNSNSGSITKPFLTLEAARDAIRKQRKAANFKKNFVIYLREGVYFIKKSFELNSEDASKTTSVIYKAYRAEYVELNGGAIIKPENCQPVTDNSILNRLPFASVKKVYKINLSAMGFADFGVIHSAGFRRPYYPSAMELFIDKKPMEIARYPNDSALKIETVIDKGAIPSNSDFSNRSGIIGYTSKRPEKWTKASELWIGGFFTWAWADDAMPLKSIDTYKKTITTSGASMFGFDTGYDFRRWYVFNLLEEIDQPGEYFIDRKTGILYFYPPINFNNSLIEVSLLEEPMVVFQNCSNTSFENINFENMRGMAIYMEGGGNNVIKNCTLKNIGMVAVTIGKGIEPFSVYKEFGSGKPVSKILGSWHEHIYANPTFNREAGVGNGIIGCNIYNIGNGGVSLGGGNRTSLEPAGNFVKKSNIHHFNRLGKSYKAAVNIDGVGNIISANHIHQADQAGIYLHGNNHIIEYNEIDSTCLKTDDMGAIYMGRDPSETGNLIRYNYFHHLEPLKKGYQIAGIFLDDGAMGANIHGNIFYRTGSDIFGAININGGYEHKINNNIFIDCIKMVSNYIWDETRWKNYLKEDLWQKRLYKVVDIERGVYSKQYPSLAKAVLSNQKLSQIKMNLSFNSGDFFIPGFLAENNMVTQKDPGLNSLQNRDFKLNNNSMIFSKISGFKQVPFEKMGLRGSIAGNLNEKR